MNKFTTIEVAKTLSAAPNRELDLESLSFELCEIAKARGAEGVIISLSTNENSQHSKYHVAYRGRCIEVEGLLQRTKHEISKIWSR